MGKHISAEELRKFMSGQLGSAAARRVVRHLLTACSECRAAAAASGRFLLEVEEELEPAGVAGDEHVYDAVIDRALASVLRRHLPRLEKECAILDRLLAAVAEKPSLMDAMQTVRRRSHGGWPEVEAMLRLSAQERYRDRAKMLELAMFANVAAGSLDPAVYGAGLVADLQARTMGELANAFRLNDEFGSAEAFLSLALERTQQGSGDGLVVARLLDLSASLYMSQRLLGEALETLKGVEQMYRKNGETHLAGRALISLGSATFYDERPQEAAQLFRRGLAEIDQRQDPQLATTKRAGSSSRATSEMHLLPTLSIFFDCAGLRGRSSPGAGGSRRRSGPCSMCGRASWLGVRGMTLRWQAWTWLQCGWRSERRVR